MAQTPINKVSRFGSRFQFAKIFNNNEVNIIEIKYIIDFNGTDMVLPEGKILFFNGGYFENYNSITGNNTYIKHAGLSCFYGNGNLQGTFTNKEISISVFDTPSNGDLSDYKAISECFKIADTVNLEKGETYAIDQTLFLEPNQTLNGNGAEIKRITNVFDMIESDGNDNVVVKNLKVNGDRVGAGLSPVNVADRFCGISFISADNCKVENVEVTETVNGEIQAEKDRGSIIFKDCDNGVIDNIVVRNNDRTGVFVNGGSNISITNVTGFDNLGSTLSTRDCPNSYYNNIKSFNSGYSGVSINTKNSIIGSIYATGTAVGYSGVNIGHTTIGSEADNCVVNNVVCEANNGWGLTADGSSNIVLNNVNSFNNEDEGLKLLAGALNFQVTNSNFFGCVSTVGIRVATGSKGHLFNNIKAYDNASSGLDFQSGTDAKNQVSNSIFYNNGRVNSGQAGVLIASGVDVKLNNILIYDNQGTKTQGSSLWLAGGTASLVNCEIQKSLTDQIRITSSGVLKSSLRTKRGTDALEGEFTPDTTAYTVLNNNSRTKNSITIKPLNASAMALGTGFVSSVSVAASFTISFASTPTGTELYSYTID